MTNKTETALWKLLEEIYKLCYGGYTPTEKRIRNLLDDFLDEKEIQP